MPTTERVFQIFKELNQIPRPSHHEERVADYLGMTRGLVPDIFRGQNTVKFVQDEKYSTKSGDFLRFCCTFAMSLTILLVLICSTKVGEKSDMAKS